MISKVLKIDGKLLREKSTKDMQNLLFSLQGVSDYMSEPGRDG